MKPANNAPMYCAMYVQLTEVCRKHGYALTVHGSMARDFDLVAIPWVDEPSTSDIVISEITTTFAVTHVGEPSVMKHNRLCYTLAMYGEFFFDFSFMPIVKTS